MSARPVSDGGDGCPKFKSRGYEHWKRVPGMGARFAGSQRLGDRRRRRLAVETDDLSGASGFSGGAGRKVDDSAPDGRARVVDDAHLDRKSAPPAALREFPISRLIPRQWWTYLIGGTASLSIGAGLLAAGWCSAELSIAAGPGIERLFAFSEAPALHWFSGLLLSVSAQLALVIWWARSKRAIRN